MIYLQKIRVLAGLFLTVLFWAAIVSLNFFVFVIFTVEVAFYFDVEKVNFDFDFVCSDATSNVVFDVGWSIDLQVAVVGFNCHRVLKLEPCLGLMAKMLKECRYKLRGLFEVAWCVVSSKGLPFRLEKLQDVWSTGAGIIWSREISNNLGSFVRVLLFLFYIGCFVIIVFVALAIYRSVGWPP